MIQRIVYSKPDITLLSKEFFAVDMHVHTEHSDSYTKVASLMKAVGKKGIGVAITDHNEVRGALRALRTKHAPMVIPGMELTTSERAHFLIYFYSGSDARDFFSSVVKKMRTPNPYMFTNLSVFEAMDRLRDYNAIIGAAHPVSPTLMGVWKHIKRGFIEEDFLKKLDFIEAICGSHTEKMNLYATKLALEAGRGYTGGSDAHILNQFGRVLTYADAGDKDSFLDSIRKRKNFVVGKASSRMAKIPSYSAVVNKHLRYIKPTIEIKARRAVKEGIEYHVPRIMEKISETKAKSKEKLESLAENGKKRMRKIKEKGARAVRKVKG